MPRIRTIKPEFPHSESMGRVSRDARLTFVLLWTVADDSGRLRGNSRMLASLLFPYDDDAPNRIDAWLSELEQENCIVRYKVEGDSYIEIRNWLEHQKIDKPSPSKIPPFANVLEDSANAREHSSLDQGPGPRTKEGTKDTICGETQDASSPPAESREPAVLEFPCDGTPRAWWLTESQIAEWRELFPSLDVLAECRAALAWVLADSTRRKTARGMQRFLAGWLGRAQNRGGVRATGMASSVQRPRAVRSIADDPE